MGKSKQLRSLIHEMLPLELRVEIDLLSRRRDISNAEKQEELFKLLRKYNINDITALGSGTNRYAFKLNGFVIKVATDNDGKIDNLKEFKMAKRLYPHVIKIHEVSSNGTLQVCEYIQPFQSYGEMLGYESQIKEILNDLSSVYLIGDVGVTRKNYANWGLRVGQDKPVCLDFAYVYEVNSELFICSHCKNNSMLLPTQDYTELYCPAPGCGRRYTFEDIRAKLGNDLHRHEIGDLSEEGYLMSESNVETELTLERSNYLMKQKKVVEEVNKCDEEDEYVDNFFIPTPKPTFKIKEDKTMEFTTPATQITNWNKNDDKITFIPARQVIDDKPETAGSNTVAFSGYIQGTVEEVNGIPVNNIPKNDSMDTDIPVNTEESVETVSDNTKTESGTLVIPNTTLDGDGMFIKNDGPDDNNETEDAPEYTCECEDAQCVCEGAKITPFAAPESIKDELAKAVSKYAKKHINSSTNIDTIDPATVAKNVSAFSSKVGKWLEEINVIDELVDDVKNGKNLIIAEKMKLNEEIASAAQNAVYHALTEFCKFEKTTSERKDKSTFTKYVPTDISETAKYYPTLQFINGFVNSNEFKFKSIEDAINTYRKNYTGYVGLQPDIAKILFAKIKQKVNRLTDTGLSILFSIIKDKWVHDVIVEKTSDTENNNESIDESVVEESNGPFNDNNISESESETVEENTEEVAEEISENSDNQDENESATPSDQLVFKADDETKIILNRAPISCISRDEIAFSGSIEDNSDDEDDEDEDNESSEFEAGLNVEIHHDDDHVVIRLVTADAYGTIAIPFYCQWDDVTSDSTPNCDIDDRNGVWEWLAYIAPDMRFYTSDPDKWVSQNDNLEDDETKFIILDSNDDETEFLMGCYVIKSIREYDIDGNPVDISMDTITKINGFVGGDMSLMHNHLRITTTCNLDLVYTEEFIESLIDSSNDMEDTDSSDEDDNEDSDETSDELEDAALAAILGNSFNNDEDESSNNDENFIDQFIDESVTFKPIHRKKRRNSEYND